MMARGMRDTGVAARKIFHAEAQRGGGAEKMKPSGIPWIGDIPEGWNVYRIGAAYDITLGKMLSTEKIFPGDTQENYLCAANIKWTGVDTEVSKQMWFSAEEKEQLVLEDGDVLVMEGGLAGTATIYRGEFAPCYIQNSVLRCRTNSSKNNLTSFLYYWLYAIYSRGYIDSICNKSTIQHYTKDKIVHTPFPVVPVIDQRRIVDYLDEKCAAIDAAVAEAKKGIEEYKAWKTSLIDDIVCNGITRRDSKKETGEVWLANIPEEWNFTQIRYLFALRDERNDKPLKDVNLISLYTDKGVVQHSDLEKTTGNKASTADGYKLVCENDIVVNIILCWMGAVGRSAYNGVTSPAYDVYRPIDPTKVLSRYYHYLFRTPRFNGKCYEEGRGIMMMRWRTYSSEFRAIKVPVPPLAEQKAIADYLDKKCAAIDALVAEKEALIADLEAYKKSLIYETVTGKREVA